MNSLGQNHKHTRKRSTYDILFRWFFVLLSIRCVSIYSFSPANKPITPRTRLLMVLSQANKPPPGLLLTPLLKNLKDPNVIKELKEIEKIEENGNVMNIQQYNTALKALGKARQWEMALTILTELHESSEIEPNAESYANVMRACVKAGKPDKAIALYESMDSSIPKDLDVFKAVLEAFKATGQSNMAIDTLEEAEKTGVALDLIAYTNAMEACLKGQKCETVFQIFEGMKEQKMQPDVISCGPVLKAYAKLGNMTGALDTLDGIKRAGQKVDTIAYNTVLNQFGVRLGMWNECLQLLDKMQEEGPEPDVESYNIVMKACAKANKWDEVVDFFGKLSDPKHPPANWKTYAIALKAAQKSKRWHDALTIFEVLVDGNDHMEPEAYSIALEAILHSGQSWQRALSILHQIPCPTPGDYSIGIRCCTKFGEYSKAIEVFELARDNQEVPVSSSLYAAAMQTHLKMKKPEKVMELFEELRSQRIKPSMKVYGLAISERKKAADGKKALQLLKMMQRDGLSPSIVHFSNAIQACYHSHLWLQATQILNEMRRQRIERDLVVYMMVLRTCIEARQGEKALEVFNQVQEDGIEPTAPCYNFGLKACILSKRWDLARDLLDEIKAKDCSIVDIKLYSSMINACAQIGWADQCLEILSVMRDDGIEADSQIYAVVMKTCMKAGKVNEVLKIFDSQFAQGGNANTPVYQSALQAAAAVSNWQTVTDLLEKMEAKGHKPDGLTLSWIMKSLRTEGMTDEALQLFEEIKSKGWDDHHAHTEAIITYGQQKKFTEAKHLFDALQSAGKPSTTQSYNVILEHYRDSSDWNSCIRLLKNMLKNDLKPDHTSFALSIEACLKDQPPQIKKAFSLLDIMYNSKLEPSATEYNLIIARLFGMAKWPTIVSCFNNMLKQKVECTAETYSYVIQAYAAMGRIEKASGTYLKAQKKGAKFDVETRASVLESLVLSSLASRKYEQVMIFVKEMQRYSVSIDYLIHTIRDSVKSDAAFQSAFKIDPQLAKIITFVDESDE